MNLKRSFIQYQTRPEPISSFPMIYEKSLARGELKVHARFDGHPYDGSIVNMGVKDEAGNICYIIGVQKAIRVAIGKQAGDRVQVTIQERME